MRAIAEAMFDHVEGHGRLAALVDDVLVFAANASFTTRVSLRAALLVLRLAPLLLFVAIRPLDRLARDRRRDVLLRLEKTPLGLAFVAWRTLLILHFYEDARELARIGYREDRRRHLAVIPVPTESGVRLRDGSDVPAEEAEEKGAA